MPLPRRAPADPQAPAAGSPYGYFDGVVGGIATGWCWRSSDPSERLEVEVVVDGSPVAKGIAKGRRDNVARAGFGDGRYGFRVPLPAQLDDGGSHRVSVRADGVTLPAASVFIGGGPARRRDGEPDDGAGRRWADTKFTADEAAGESGDDRRPRRRGRKREAEAAETVPATISGYVDGISGSELIGWVADPAHPEISLTVEAFFDGASLGEVVADLSRSDVARAGYGAEHGFRFELPAAPQPGLHTIDVRTTEGMLHVPVTDDYVVVDDEGSPVEGVVLRVAMRAAPPRIVATPREALVGLGGWLFEWPSAGDFHVLRGAEALKPEVFEWHLARTIERNELAQAAGAAFVGAILPARSAVYAEQLPAGLEVDSASRPAELLVAAIRERNDVALLDLAAPLRQAKPFGPVFTRTGRGVTWLGAFAAYRAIAKLLARSRSEITPLLRDDLVLGPLEPVSDPLAELARVVWLGSTTMSTGTAAGDEDREGEPRLDRTRMSCEYVVLGPELTALAGEAAALLGRRQPSQYSDALVIHDGSAERIAPFLAEHFERTLVVGPGADIEGLLTEFAPAAVVEVVAESTLLRD